jgi:predicted ATPase
MGYGEARTLYLIESIENLQDKSLILIEEPETSLHPSAQHELGKYFIDVCIRRGHQILMTTHSEYLLESLPSQSRVYLHRNDTGISVIKGLTASQANSLMTDCYKHALNVMVEDDVAKEVLSEIIRKIDSNFLSTLLIRGNVLAV